MKKNSLKKAFSVIAMAAVAVSATSAVASATEETFAPDGGYSADVIAASTVKPVTDVTKIVVGKDQAGQQVKVQISVDNANAKFCSTGMHFYYDSRLTLETDPFGDPLVKKGAGTEYLGTIKIQADPTAAKDFGSQWNGVFFATAESADKGLNGVLYEMNLTIPADAKEGDVYPLDVIYRSNKNAKDLFTNKANDETGKIMQAYFFTQGIYNSARTYTSPADEPAYVADVMNGSTYDGYIAIEKIEETTTAPVTTTTAAPTTTTTAAPTTTTAAPATTTAAPVSTTAAPVSTTAAPVTGSTTAAPGSATTAASTAAPATTAAPAATTAAPTNAPKTGVPGAGMAVAGLAAAIGTAFVLRKKED